MKIRKLNIDNNFRCGYKTFKGKRVCSCKYRKTTSKDKETCIKCGLKIVIEHKQRDNKHIAIFKEYRGDINQCQKCGNNLCLQIHHIDKKHKNNYPLNLIKLCLICHCKAHLGDSVYPLMIKRLKFLLS